MIYQDTWINGQLKQKGIRECSLRYDVIKEYCKTLPVGFTICDIGANMCYFGLRLIEDFQCSVIAFEFNSFEMRQKEVEKNKTDKLMFLKRKISLPDLEILSKTSHFDLLLVLSVMHHLPGNSQDWISSFRKLADNVIIEFALEDSDRTKIRKGYGIPEDAIILGYGDSHLKNNFQRPIILLK